MTIGPDEYRYHDASPTYPHEYLDPIVVGLIEEERRGRVERIFELGCGNGSFLGGLASAELSVVGVDVSESGISAARAAFPRGTFEVASAYDDLAKQFGKFDIVISLEVVEHLSAPRKWARNVSALLNPGGLAIVSTPYHGYLKNLALSIFNRWDKHLDPLWDHGHIKMWSVKTLRSLLEEVGLVVESVHRVGRIPPLAKSMIMTARKADE